MAHTYAIIFRYYYYCNNRTSNDRNWYVYMQLVINVQGCYVYCATVKLSNNRYDKYAPYPA